MIVSAFSDGHGGYGLRVPERKVSMFFRPEWRWVTIHLPDTALPIATWVSESFWRGSPELRSVHIRDFLERANLLDWEKNRPPQFEFEPRGGGAFNLKFV